MDYRQQVIKDFAERTRQNLDFIEKSASDGAEVYEITQLVNSLTRSNNTYSQFTNAEGALHLLVGPVFTREVVMMPRRTRLYVSRAAYVAASTVTRSASASSPAANVPSISRTSTSTRA